MESLTVLGPSSLPSIPAIISNITILVIFASIVGAGVVRGLKEVREFRKPTPPGDSTKAQMAAVTILENVTLNDWTTSNKQVVTAIGGLVDVICQLIEALRKDREERLEHRSETSNLRHATARLHDEIEELRRDLAHSRNTGGRA